MDPPVPIPNTVVKHINAESTWLETAWEDKKLPVDKRLSRDSLFCCVKIYWNTACGHNDFCSVRLNGPTWWLILTHQYRLSLSQFTEAVMVEIATGATFAAQKQESPDAKVSCPSGCWLIITLYLCSVLLIQPAVMATFALSDLMALSEDLYWRSNTACRWANSQRP